MPDTINEIEAKIAELQAEESALKAQESAPAGSAVIEPSPFDKSRERLFQPASEIGPRAIKINPISTYVAPTVRTVPAVWPLQPLTR